MYLETGFAWGVVRWPSSTSRTSLVSADEKGGGAEWALGWLYALQDVVKKTCICFLYSPRPEVALLISPESAIYTVL